MTYISMLRALAVTSVLAHASDTVSANGLRTRVPNGWNYELKEGTILTLRNYPLSAVLPQGHLPKDGAEIMIQPAITRAKRGASPGDALECALYQSVRSLGTDTEGRVGLVEIDPASMSLAVRLTRRVALIPGAPEAELVTVDYFFTAFTKPIVVSLICRQDDTKCSLHEETLKAIIRSLSSASP